jgi:hypothetical protein
MKPKPPEILRKSHRHSDRKERAAAHEKLRHELEDVIAETDELQDAEGVEPTPEGGDSESE